MIDSQRKFKTPNLFGWLNKSSEGRFSPTPRRYIRITNQLLCGFTITEILVAMTILGVLSGIAISAYSGQVAKARYDVARSVLINIYKSEIEYCSTSVDDGGSEGAKYVGDIPDDCLPATNMLWNDLKMENPNTCLADSVVYSIQGTVNPCEGAGTGFTAVAWYNSTVLNVRKFGNAGMVFSGDWTR